MDHPARYEVRPPLEFAVTGDPKPYRRALSDGRGGRRRHPDADPWKWATRLGCARAILHGARKGPGMRAALGLAGDALDDAFKALEATRVRWGPPEPWFPPHVPLTFSATVWLLRPKSHFLKSGNLKRGAPEFPTGAGTGSGDAVNFGKELEDAVAAWPSARAKQAGGKPLAYRDDAQVVSSKTTKLWCDGLTPGAHVRIAVFGFDDSRLD